MIQHNKQQLRAELDHINRELETAFLAFNSKDFIGSVLLSGTHKSKPFNELFTISFNDPLFVDYLEKRASKFYAKKLLLEKELGSPDHSDAVYFKTEVAAI